MKALTLLFAPLMVSATVPKTMVYDGMPPARFQGPATVKAIFGRIDKCGKANIPGRPDVYFESCIRGGVTYLPDPCAYPEETFARLTCHELAHSRGWPADHGE